MVDSVEIDGPGGMVEISCSGGRPELEYGLHYKDAYSEYYIYFNMTILSLKEYKTDVCLITRMPFQGEVRDLGSNKTRIVANTSWFLKTRSLYPIGEPLADIDKPREVIFSWSVK